MGKPTSAQQSCLAVKVEPPGSYHWPLDWVVSSWPLRAGRSLKTPGSPRGGRGLGEWRQDSRPYSALNRSPFSSFSSGLPAWLFSPSHEPGSLLSALPAEVSPQASADTSQTAARALADLGHSFRVSVVPRASLTASPGLLRGGYEKTSLDPIRGIQLSLESQQVSPPKPRAGPRLEAEILETRKLSTGSGLITPKFKGLCQATTSQGTQASQILRVVPRGPALPLPPTHQLYLLIFRDPDLPWGSFAVLQLDLAHHGPETPSDLVFHE